MENPGDLLWRARLNRQFKGTPEAQHIQKSADRPTVENTVHCSSHASYTALMRSHDRMRTRHIIGQGGRNGA